MNHDTRVLYKMCQYSFGCAQYGREHVSARADPRYCNRLWISWSSLYELDCTYDYYIVQMAVLETALSVLKWVQIINLFWRWSSGRGYCWKYLIVHFIEGVTSIIIRWGSTDAKTFLFDCWYFWSGTCLSSERVKL